MISKKNITPLHSHRVLIAVKPIRAFVNSWNFESWLALLFHLLEVIIWVFTVICKKIKYDN